MTFLNKGKVISALWWVFAPMLVAGFIVSIGKFFLSDKAYLPLYFENRKSLHVYELPKFFEIKNTQIKHVNSQRLNNMKLKACYVEGDKQFIIIEENKKINFIDLQGEFKGAKLVKVSSNSAIFLQGGEKIFLSLENQKSKNTSMITNIKTEENKEEKYISVKREDFEKYIKDAQESLKDIRVKDLISKDKFEGLEIIYIRKDSFFDEMSLKQGDIIKSIDDIALEGMMSLIPHYKNLENISTLKLEILRDGKMKEIVYEID